MSVKSINVMSKGLVSVIVPTYNASVFLRETIDSILNQSYQNIEVLITDDQSTDQTVAIVNEYIRLDDRVKLFVNPVNSGAGVSRNNSIKEASGDWIAFCDADDVWLPHKIQKQLDFMIANDIDLCYSAYNIISENGMQLGIMNVPDKLDYRIMLRNDYIGCLTAVYNAKKVGKVYMPSMRKRQDWALWLDVLKKTDRCAGIKEPLANYRLRSGSISSNKMEMFKYNFQVYRIAEGFSFLYSAYRIVLYPFWYFIKKCKYSKSI